MTVRLEDSANPTIAHGIRRSFFCKDFSAAVLVAFLDFVDNFSTMERNCYGPLDFDLMR